MTQPDPIKTIDAALCIMAQHGIVIEAMSESELKAFYDGVRHTQAYKEATQAINTEIQKAYRKGYAAGNAARNYGGGKAVDYKKLAQEILAQLTPVQSQPEKESNV